MNAEQTLKLIEAGFSKEEILSLFGNESKAPEGNEAVSGEPGATDQTHDSAVNNFNYSPIDYQPINIQEILKPLQTEISKLGETVKVIQETNLKNASTESPKGEDSVKNVIDSFINTL